AEGARGGRGGGGGPPPAAPPPPAVGEAPGGGGGPQGPGGVPLPRWGGHPPPLARASLLRSRRKLSEGPGWGVLSAFAETGVSSRLSARERRYASRNAPPGPALTEDAPAGGTRDNAPLGRVPRENAVYQTSY